MRNHVTVSRGGSRAAHLAIGLAAPILTAAAGWLAWALIGATDWRVWAPADVIAPAMSVLAALAGARFVAQVVGALVATVRGGAAPRWSGRLARATAAALLALLAGAGAASAADQAPSAGWLPASPSPAPSPSASVAVPAPEAGSGAAQWASPFGIGGAVGVEIGVGTSAEAPASPPTTPGTTSTTAAAAPPSTPAPAPAPAPSTSVPPHHHTVARGDSLWRITAELLGGSASDAQIAAAWPALYAENRGVIGEDPGLIRVGQVLSIPTELPGAAA